jgi:hypothetical protein
MRQLCCRWVLEGGGVMVAALCLQQLCWGILQLGQLQRQCRVYRHVR